MHIQRLVLHDFRNVADLSVDLHPAFNIIHGENAQGKTNFLEAIYILSTLKSFRAARNSDLVRWGREESMIRALSHKRDVVRDLRVNIKNRSKVMSVDNKRARSIKDTFGHLQTVLFGPEDIAISKGSASYRRTFLDRSVFQTQPSFYDTTRAYESALKNRNALLKEMQQGRVDQGMLEVFDQQLIDQGSSYIFSRLQFLRRFRSGFEQHHVGIEYESTIGIGEDFALGDIASAFASKLQADRGRDRARGFTSSGPHVDDILLSIDGHPARIHASQGQHRTLVLALKIGEISHLHHELGYRPILLLDDVSSELDRSRNQQLMEFLLEKSGQVFITTTDPAYIALNTEAKLLHMDKGELQDLR